jgi:hypothetical protein
VNTCKKTLSPRVGNIRHSHQARADYGMPTGTQSVRYWRQATRGWRPRCLMAVSRSQGERPYLVPQKSVHAPPRNAMRPVVGDERGDYLATTSSELVDEPAEFTQVRPKS